MIDPSKNGEYPITASKSFTTPSTSNRLFALRYNFKPDSIDDSQASVLTRSGADFTLQSPGIQKGETFSFSGQHTESKDVDCVLIYNEETNSFELQRLSGVIRLKSSRSSPTKPSAKPISSLSSSTPAIKDPIVRQSKDDRVIDLPSLDDISASELEIPARKPAIRAREPSPVSDEDDDEVPLAQSAKATAVKPVTAVQQAQEESSDEDDNESLQPAQQRQPQSARSRFAHPELESSSDEDEDEEPRSSQPMHARQSQPPPLPQVRAPVPIPVSSRAPISLRGYAGNRRVEDDISSSSEEE
ncbi:RNA polymerase II transcription elongation factor-domain-containing protein [Kockiozyma suomiensis]|uniref:RNA polymerase II transcription elongation factor-domain-containing protein n=1 Tax=Kockiozyma suomiensis TaxID=1337062 RepID=UPI003343DEF9